MGELSPFHETFGYYALGQEGVATLPAGWAQRLVKLQNPATRGAIGWCLEVHDLLISKYIANRANDRRYCQVAAEHGLAEKTGLIERLKSTEVDAAVSQLILLLLDADFAKGHGQTA